MAKYKRMKSATEWLAMSPLEREYYKPKRMSRAEQEELLESEDFVQQALYKKELVDRARLKWALTHTSWKKKYEFIEQYGDPEYKGDFQGKLKNALSGYWKQEKQGEIEDIGWYLNAAYSSDVDYGVLQQLDALAQILSHEELQQLYHDLPSIRDYYITKGKEMPGAMENEWSNALSNIVYMYYDMMKDDPKKVQKLNAILEEDEDTPW